MPTTTDVKVSNLIINKMTQEQYDNLPEKSPTELYVIEGDSNVIYAEQATTLPTAAESNLGKIYQYIGTTDANYTNGYFYKCVGEATPQSFVFIEDITKDFPERDPSQPCELTVTIDDLDDFANKYCKVDNQLVPCRLYFGVSTGDEYILYNYTTEVESNMGDEYENVHFDGLYIAGSDDYTGDGVIYQYTPASNGYIWERVDVQPTVDPLPDQAGNSGKFLTTNGTEASWATVDALPDQTGQNGKFLTTDGTDASWSNKPLVNTGTNAGLAIQTANYVYVGDNQESLVIGPYSRIYNGKYCTLLGGTATIHDLSNNTVRAAVVVGDSATSSRSYTTALGTTAITDAIGAIQIGKGTNTEAGTVRFGLTTNGSTWQNYKLLDSNGTIPADRLINSIAKYSTIPTAVSTNEGWIIQYTGVTDSTYTHGYIYECVSDGAAEPTYSWVQVDVQPAADPLPSQSGKNGKFLMTDGTTASWEDETTVEFRVWGAND